MFFHLIADTKKTQSTDEKVCAAFESIGHEIA
jgi:hypothetical protein